MNCPATQIFKSYAAGHRQVQDGKIHVNDCPGGSLNIFTISHKREETRNTMLEKEERIDIPVQSLPVPSDAETRTQPRPHIVSSCDTNMPTLRHRPTGLRAAWSDPTQGGYERATIAQRRSSTPTLVADPTLEMVHLEDGRFDVSEESMAFIDDSLCTSSSSSSSEASTPGSASRRPQSDPLSEPPDCMWAWSDEELPLTKASRMDSVPQPSNLKPLQFTASVDKEFSTADNGSTPIQQTVQPHARFEDLHSIAKQSAKPNLTIRTTSVRPPAIVIPRVQASSRLSMLAASANPRLARQLSNLALEDVRFRSHRDSVALSRLRLRAGTVESADQAGRERHRSGG